MNKRLLKRLLVLLVINLTFYNTYSQCPGNITFTSQAQIDAFPTNYPGCTVVTGDLTVQQNPQTPITNLNGLSQITKVGGRLKLNNSNITSLLPLSNLDTIAGPFESAGLLNSTLNGLQNLKYIGSHYQIWNYANLTDISALSNLTHIGGAGLIIGHNPQLTNINGVQNIGTITEFLLENNNVMADISAMENVNITNYLRIINNPQLSACNVDPVCNFLSVKPPSSYNVSNNAAGCNSRLQVLANCNLPCPTNLNFTSQAQIDEFGIIYGSCTEIQGNINIAQQAQTPITNLNGLSNLHKVGGNFVMTYSSINTLAGLANLDTVGGAFAMAGLQCANLNGLQNLKYIGLNCQIWNFPNLTNIAALNNLTHIGYDGLGIGFNPLLTNLNGLENLTDLGILYVVNNNSLNNIEGVNNVATLYNVTFQNNPQLALCNVDVICNFLATAPPNSYNISNNAVGCNSRIQVLANCNLPCPTSLNFTSQAQIDEFGIVHSECTEIIGDVTVRQEHSTPITNINGLANLEKVGGRLIIGNSNITSLAPLSNLDSILGAFESGWLFNTSLNGLQNLKYIGSHYQIFGYFNLTDISALSNLNHVGGAGLIIGHNPMLTNLNGVQNVGQITELLIESNNSLTDISAVENLSISFYLRITNNPQLSVCNVDAVCNFLAEKPISSAYIANNAAGCNTVQNVLTGCEQYCLSQGNNANFDHIGDVILGDEHHASGLSNYSDFTGVTLSLNKNLPTLLTITPNKIFPTDLEYYKVWIDFDNDFEFAEDELVFNQATTGTPSALLDIPDEVTNGTKRMRVSMSYNQSQSACEYFPYGEVEDYSVNIIEHILGCTDPDAHNFNDMATLDDHSCLTCNDTLLNGDEIGVDCGGSICETCPPPVAVCGDIMTVYVDASDLVYNGPGTSDVFLIDGTILIDPASTSRAPFYFDVKRKLTNVAFNWTTNGACIDATPNGVYNNNDKGLVWKACLPVTPADFNKVRNYELQMYNDYGSSACSGRYKVIYGSGGNNAEITNIFENDLEMEGNKIDEGIFSVHPNPGLDYLNVDFNFKDKKPENGSLYIINALGNRVYTNHNLSGSSITIDADDLPCGFYQIVFETHGTTETLKWLKIE